MDTQRRWIGFDTFKLIVALLLLVLLLVLLLQRPAVAPATSASQESPVGVAVAATQTAPAATQTPPAATNTVAVAAATQAVAASLTPTLAAPTATLASAATQTPTLVPATETPTQAPEAQTPTLAVATVEPTATAQAAPTETPQPQAAAGDCPLAQPSRLAVGQQALVLINLNVRQDAGMDKQIIRVGLPNSKVDIIGGPVCTPYQNGAYLWWNVKSADGVTGWSAEASLSKNFYFLQPAP